MLASSGIVLHQVTEDSFFRMLDDEKVPIASWFQMQEEFQPNDFHPTLGLSYKLGRWLDRWCFQQHSFPSDCSLWFQASGRQNRNSQPDNPPYWAHHSILSAETGSSLQWEDRRKSHSSFQVKKNICQSIFMKNDFWKAVFHEICHVSCERNIPKNQRRKRSYFL